MKRALRIVVLAIAAALALSGCGFHGLYSANLPGGANLGGHPYTVTIYFRDVLDLVPQSAVKSNDISVGKVESITLDGWMAKVKVKVNSGVHLPANARAAVRMTSLLGEKFVDLQQPLATPEGKLGNGSVIPVTSTDTAPEVEEVLGSLSLVLNEGGLNQIHTIATELNKALKGNEPAIRDLLTQLNGFVGTVDNDKDKVTQALVDIDNLAKTLNAQKQTIIDTLDTMPKALKILSDNRGQLVDLLSSLSNLGNVATRIVNASQKSLVNSLQDLQPVLERLTATGDTLPKALGILLTYPFPVGATENFVKGDYANLNLFLDINATNNLCGLNPALCNLVPNATTKNSTTTKSNTTTKSADENPLPSFPGASG
jgi:phospholipid/cholesterol/gamma-HCH transport system substrate-binding protein